MATPLPVETDCGKGSDRISQLPDDILMSFISISTMGMKEAAKTSIVSKRWRYLWTKGTTHLDFNHSIVFPDFNVKYCLFPTRDIKKKYIKWVNQVVALHYSSPSINTFRACFGFEKRDTRHIDKWVKFAISKQVKNLELCCVRLKDSFYTLRFDILKQTSLDFLQSLCLKSINWSNVVFKNTPNLVEARFNATRVSDFAPIFQQNSNLAQISKLSLDMKLGVLPARSLPTFCNLKQLTMMFDYDYGDNLIASINQFLKACPKLREFKVEFTDPGNISTYDEANQLNDDDYKNEDFKREYFRICYEMELDRKGHPNLREFQVAGFCGWVVDVDLILFIALISFNLETVICDCSHANNSSVAQEVTQALKSRAAKLVKLIPPKITLAII